MQTETSVSLKPVTIALVLGDGSAPEMMREACRIAAKAAELDGIQIFWEGTTMGWGAFKQYGDTLPPDSLKRAVEIGTVFFGGVGNPELDKTLGVRNPGMSPESKCLLALRKEMGLLLNFRPAIFYKNLDHLALVRPENIPDGGIEQLWLRFLLQDSYFGNEDFLQGDTLEAAMKIGAKLKKDVTGDEEHVVDIAYYKKKTIEKYIRAAFSEARARGLPLISIDKMNVMSRYLFWRKIVTRIGAEEFPDIPLTHHLVDSANALLFTPAALHGVIACGNEHGDILSDGALASLGSMGLMCSSAVNPDTGAAMFESGAGTAPTLAGKNMANPIGRILTGAMMLRHIGAPKGAKVIEDAIQTVLRNGYRTGDLIRGGSREGITVVGTTGMGDAVLKAMEC